MSKLIETYGKTVCFLAGGIDACSIWRESLPYLNLPQCGFHYQFDPSIVLTHDYVMVQRLGLQQNLQAMKTLRAVGLKIIYDLDDFLWDIPDWNPHAELLRQVAYGYSVCLRHADVITVSTYPLKKAILRHHKRELINIMTGHEIPIIVCENKIDMRLVAAPQHRDGLIVGWAGSNTHDKDMAIILPTLARLIDEFPNVTFEFGGWMPEELKKFSNVRFRDWTPVCEWFMRYPRWGWDIALAPLHSHPFNSAKSGNKATESGAMGVPCLMSYEPPYSDWCKTGVSQLKWLLCTGPESWYNKLKTLIVDEAHRKMIGKLCHQNTVEHHSWNGGHEGWQNLFDTLESL